MGNDGVNGGEIGNDRAHGEGDNGVLLYYNFVAIPDPNLLKDWFISLCASLAIVGRIRIAPVGINVTVGGKMASLYEHIKAVDSHPLLKGCDFKLAACSKPMNYKIAEEIGFSSVSVRVVKELVTLGLPPSVCPPSILDAGEHLSAVEFHRQIQEAASIDKSVSHGTNEDSFGSGITYARDSLSINAHNPLQTTGTDEGGKLNEGCRAGTAILSEVAADDKPCKGAKLVVLDARNIYETRIGRFVPPPGVEFLDPKVRQYSDLPGWIDSNEEHLRNKRILMYCTGGVRCEMASAYLRSKGKGFENVYQLSGGIQRYLEAFPDGGFFKGKNFVFDHRIAVASSCSEVIGSCMSCGASFDDYSSRSRCFHCRMLVLICSSCQATRFSTVQGPVDTCELCGANRKHNETLPQKQQSVYSDFVNQTLIEPCSGETNEKQSFMPGNGRNLFTSGESCDKVATGGNKQSAEDHLQTHYVGDAGISSKRKLKILCLHGFRQNASNLKGRLASFTKKLKHIAEFVFVDAPHEVPLIFSPDSRIRYASGEGEIDEERGTKDEAKMLPHKKYAWLVSPDMMSSKCKETYKVGCLQGESRHVSDEVEKQSFLSRDSPSACRSLTGPEMSTLREKCVVAKHSPYPTMVFDQFQYKQQTAGWAESFCNLKMVFSDLGPFDGILGFSQGAAVASALCPLRRSKVERNIIDFEFLILCSGFLSPAQEHQDLMSCSVASSPFDCPSLHIFGDKEGCDRQISTETSMQLVSMFKSDCRVVLKHNSGHIVPTRKEYVNQVKAFLSQFQ